MKYLSLSLPNPNPERPPLEINPVGGMPRGGTNTLSGMLQVAVELLFIFAIIFALFMLIYSGWLWMTSAGDKQKIQQTKQRIVYAIIGLILTFLAFMIINLMSNFFGIKILKY